MEEAILQLKAELAGIMHSILSGDKEIIVSIPAQDIGKVSVPPNINGIPVRREIMTADMMAGLGRQIQAQVKRINGLAKPGYAAERLRALKQKISDESDKLVAEIDAFEQRELTAALDKGRAFLDSQRSDVQAMSDELAQLTNLPL